MFRMLVVFVTCMLHAVCGTELHDDYFESGVISRLVVLYVVDSNVYSSSFGMPDCCESLFSNYTKNLVK